MKSALTNAVQKNPRFIQFHDVLPFEKPIEPAWGYIKERIIFRLEMMEYFLWENAKK